MRRILHLLAGLAGAAALALLVIGVPAGLIAWQGNPVPRTMPHLSGLNSPLTIDTISKIVAVLMWLAWLQFLVAVVAEVRYQWPRRHLAVSRAAAPARRQLRGTGPSGALAGRLVALVLLLSAATGALASGANAASAATTSSTPARPAAVATASAVAGQHTSAAQQTARTDSAGTSVVQLDAGSTQHSNAFGIPVGATYYTVVQYDSLYNIAQHCLGDGDRYPQIYQLNKGREQPDGGRLTERSLIRPGWLLIMPAGAAHCRIATAAAAPAGADSASSSTLYTVAPTNNLSEIAQGEYGDADEWPVIYAANEGKVLDGHLLDDPSRIYPGQVLRIPALPGQAPASSSTSSTPAGPTSGSNSGTSSSTPSQGATSSAAPSSSASAAPSAGASSSPSQAASSAGSSPSSPAASSSASPQVSTTPSAAQSPASSSPAQHTPAAATVRGQDEGERFLFELLGIGGLAAAAGGGALGIRRHRQQHARLPGEYIAMGEGPLPSRLEMLMRAGEDAAGGDWLDTVLRALAATAIAQGAELPDLRLLSLGQDVLYLQPMAPAPALAPFSESGEWWVCPRTAQLPAEDELADVPAPYPSLVTIGHDEHGRAILVDLESVRALALPGPAGLGALRAVALELLGQTTADMATVTLVGVGMELADASLPASINLAVDLEDGISRLETWINFAAEQLEGIGTTSVRAARLAQDGDAPVTHVLISAEEPTEDQAERLARLLQGAPAMAAAVVTGAAIEVSGPAWVLPATRGPEPLAPTGILMTAPCLTDPDYAQLIEEFRTSGQLESVPAPAWTAPPEGGFASTEDEEDDELGAGGFAPVDDEDDGQGVDLGLALDEDEDQDEDQDEDEDEADDQADEDEPAEGAEQDAARQAAHVQQVLASHVAPLAALGAGPQVRVLGSIEVTGARGAVAEEDRDSVPLELAAFLVLNAGSKGKKEPEVTEALWPLGAARQTRNNATWRLRAWLGVDDAGKPYMPDARRGYRLHPGVGCDLIQFHTLYEQGKAAYESGRTEDAAGYLDAALGLVRGRPFVDAPAGRYVWAAKITQITVSEIGDAGRMLAEIRKAEGDWPGAALAATRAMVSGIGEFEVLFRVRYEEAYRRGDTGEMEKLAAALNAYLADNGAKMEETTLQLMRDLLERHPVAGR